MKVELSFSNDTLIAVNKQVQRIYDLPVSNDKKAKIIISIVYGIADKFDRKYRNRIQNQNLFDAKKRIKMTLKFHEAWALQQLLKILLPQVDNQYQRTLINKTIDNLDQKTC